MATFNSRFMKNLCYALLTLVLCLSACKPKTPPDIWDKEKMTEFLVEAQLLEAKISVQELPKPQADSLYARSYEELFAFYNTTREIWQKNIEYYRDKPTEMNEIYKEVVERLTLLENMKTVDKQEVFEKNISAHKKFIKQTDTTQNK